MLLVPHGQARVAAEALAQELARFPQTCLREDRRPTYEQADLSLTAAVANEFQHGMVSLQADVVTEVQRFVSGEGRHGEFAG